MVLPQEVALLCVANSVSVPRLVEEVLADFDPRAAPTDSSSGLEMMRDGQLLATVTYTFLESGTLDESQYELRSHLDEDAQIERQRFRQKERNG